MSRFIAFVAFAAAWLVAAASARAAGLLEVGNDGPAPASLVVRIDEDTQTPIETIQPFGSFGGGARVASCDVNADGTPDLIVVPGPGGTPRVLVLDGRSGATIHDFFAFEQSFSGGLHVASGDVDGDGHCDLVVARDAGAAPEVKVFSGLDDSTVLADFYAYANNVTAGVRVAAADVDGDGRAEIVTGLGPGYAPEVRVYRYAQPSPVLLHDFYAFDVNFHGGVYVAAVDVDLDGHADLVVGAGSGGLPQVSEFSGARLDDTDHGLLASFLAFGAAFSGGVRVAAGDGDGDGIPEVAFATGPGATQVKLTYLTSPPPESGFFPFGTSNTDGSFVAIAPRSDTIFADSFDAR